MEDIDFKKIAYDFEAVKYSVRQNSREGVILSLKIDPVVCPQDVYTDDIGSRYMIALVKIGDDDVPAAGEKLQLGNKAVDIAGMLCRDNRFQMWLAGKVPPMFEEALLDNKGSYESATAAVLRNLFRINSRSELKTNEKAREDFFRIRNEFILAMRDGRA